MKGEKMLKIFVIYVLVLIGLAVCGKKESNTSKIIFFYAHLFGGIFLTALGIFHGFNLFWTAPLKMQLTGCAMLMLFLTQLILGILIYRQKRSNLKKMHGLLAILIFCLLVLHVILLKLF